MIRLFQSRLGKSLTQPRVVRCQRLPLIKGLRADFPAVIDTHECCGAAPRFDIQIGLGDLCRRGAAQASWRAEKGAQSTIKLHNQFVCP